MSDLDAKKRKKTVMEFVDVIRDNGAETIIRDYALMLDRTKFNVVVFVLYNCPEFANRKILEENGIKIISLYRRESFLYMLWNKLFKRWWIPFRLSAVMKRENVDILHVHLALLQFVKPIAKKINDVRLFYTCHSLPERYFGAGQEREYISAKYLISNNNLRLIALQHEMAQELNRLFSIDNTLVVRNGIDLNKYSGMRVDRKTQREKLGIPSDAFVIGHVGRFTELKNHSLIVDTFAKVHKSMKNAFLLLVGDGELKDEINKRLSEEGLDGKYLILSHRSDINDILTAMDVFIFPSKFEGLGIAFVEAQAAGLPCVISDAIPTDAYLSPDITVLSVDDGIDKWAQAVIHHDGKCETFGKLQDYDMNTEIKKLEQLYLGTENP